MQQLSFTSKRKVFCLRDPRPLPGLLFFWPLHTPPNSPSTTLRCSLHSRHIGLLLDLQTSKHTCTCSHYSSYLKTEFTSSLCSSLYSNVTFREVFRSSLSKLAATCSQSYSLLPALLQFLHNSYHHLIMYPILNLLLTLLKPRS